MRKIPTLFVRDPDDRAHVLPQIDARCQWVADGEGRATRKYDGTCVMLDEGGVWWARREVKAGKARPDGYVAVSTDEVTGKTMGWEPVGQSAFAKFHAEAVADGEPAGGAGAFEAGTYELVGPKINGNPERAAGHRLIRHADAEVVEPAGRDFESLRAGVRRLAEEDGAEGLVFHHPDGRMAKIKARDFTA
jgi:hypothetical protein